MYEKYSKRESWNLNQGLPAFISSCCFEYTKEGSFKSVCTILKVQHLQKNHRIIPLLTHKTCESN